MIRIHRATKYKIRTKYNDNLRHNKDEKSQRQYLCNVWKEKGQKEKEQMANNGPN